MDKGVGAKKERLCIYLVRLSGCSDGAIIKMDDVKSPSFNLKVGSMDGKLYIRREVFNKRPRWVDFLLAGQGVSPDVFGYVNNIGAVLIIRAFDNIFAITFGSGYLLLEDEAIEKDFGLRVTLNSVNPEMLRSLDKTNCAHNPLHSRTQSTQHGGVFDFNVDSETDLLYAITGVSEVEMFGSHVTGKDALFISPEVEMNDLPEVLMEALKRYKQSLPQKFEWVDNVCKVKNKDEIQIIEMELERLLNKEPMTDKLWLGEPEIVDWGSISGYSFSSRSLAPRYLVLKMEELLRYLKNNNRPINVETLRMQKIILNDENFQALKRWSAYKCIYAEVRYGDDIYVLRNSVWYKVKQDFAEMINDYVLNVDMYQGNLPRYKHSGEGEYNEFVKKSLPDFELLDKKNIRIGGSYDKVEFCDLVRNKNELIHVKNYTGSSTLSHLFAQGCVAAEAFVSDVGFREKLNDKLPSSLRLPDPKPRPDPGKYKIVYAIITDKNIPMELPFFTKVMLKNAHKTLRALGYGVELVKIYFDPIFLNMQNIKPKK